MQLKIRKMDNIKLFEEWSNEELNETKYHFHFDNKRYTIHQARTNPSKFGIKTKDGDWEVFVRMKYSTLNTMR